MESGYDYDARKAPGRAEKFPGVGCSFDQETFNREFLPWCGPRFGQAGTGQGGLRMAPDSAASVSWQALASVTGGEANANAAQARSPRARTLCNHRSLQGQPCIPIHS